jgi:hypothetical protein
MLTAIPRRTRCGTRPIPIRVFILVIILTFVVVMAGLGCTPEAAIGVAATAAAIANTPRTASAVRGA